MPKLKAARPDKLTLCGTRKKLRNDSELVRLDNSPLFSHRKNIKSPHASVGVVPAPRVDNSPDVEGDMCSPTAMSTPLRSNLDDFTWSQSDQVDVRWDTSSPDAVVKARKLGAKDNGKKTIEMLAAGIRRDPSLDAPSTPAVLRVWLTRDDGAVTEDATRTPRPQERRRSRRPERALRSGRAASDVSTNNLMKKIAELIEQQKEKEVDKAGDVQASESDELTCSAAVAILENQSSNDASHSHHDTEPRVILEASSAKRSTSSETNNITDNKNIDDIGNNISRKADLNEADNSLLGSRLFDSSWDDDDLFQATQITEQLYDTNDKRARTPKALKSDQNNSCAEKSRPECNDQSTRKGIESRNKFDVAEKSDNADKCSGKTRVEVSVVSNKSSNSAVVRPIPKSSRLRHAQNVNSVQAKSGQNIVRNGSVVRPIPKSIGANQSSGTDSSAVKEQIRDIPAPCHACSSDIKPSSNQRVNSMAIGSNQGTGLGNTKTEVSVQTKRISPNARPFKFPKPTVKSSVGTSKSETDSVDVDKTGTDCDTSLPDDVLLKLVECDDVWDCETEKKIDNDRNNNDNTREIRGRVADRGGKDLISVAGVEQSKTDSPLAPTLILPPSPADRRRRITGRTLPYKPAVESTETAPDKNPAAAAGSTSNPVNDEDEFDGDDSFFQADVLAQLDKVEFEATQSMKTTQSPPATQSPAGQSPSAVQFNTSQSPRAVQSANQSPRSVQSSSQSPRSVQPCSADEIQRKKEAALKKRRLALSSKDNVKRGKFH